MKKSGPSASKMYLVYTSANSDLAYFLENLEEVKFKGIKCLKGKHAELSWMKRTVVYIPVDKILGITQYDSVQQYKDACKEYYSKKTKTD